MRRQSVSFTWAKLERASVWHYPQQIFMWAPPPVQTNDEWMKRMKTVILCLQHHFLSHPLLWKRGQPNWKQMWWKGKRGDSWLSSQFFTHVLKLVLFSSFFRGVIVRCFDFTPECAFVITCWKDFDKLKFLKPYLLAYRFLNID